MADATALPLRPAHSPGHTHGGVYRNLNLGSRALSATNDYFRSWALYEYAIAEALAGLNP
jgi:hypothetical protein